MEEGDDPRYPVQLRRLRYIIVVLSVLCFALVVLLAVIYVLMDKELRDRTVPECNTESSSINLDEQNNPSVFLELTKEEIKGLQNYLYSKKSLKLVFPSEASINTSYIFTVDLHLPRKQDTLRYLDDNDTKPAREALVVIFCGDKELPVVEEYVVGPLPNPFYHKILERKDRTTQIPLHFMPVSGPIYGPIIQDVSSKADRLLKDLLVESYGGSFKNCNNKCLVLRFFTNVPSVISGEESRIIWFWGWHFVEFFILNPLDFYVSVKMVNKTYELYKVMYNEQTFSSFEELISNYKSGNVRKSRISFPEVNSSYFSTLNRRGPASSANPKPPPRQTEPDGKRYSINGRQVRYMGWQFDFKMSVQFGPQLFDIRYRNERILYELSLQEISVFYSGDLPFLKFANLLDSIALIGASSNMLIPGSDCPDSATFIDFSYLPEYSVDVKTTKNAFCVFELNTGIPLRRHHSYYKFLGRVYEGMPDVVLVFRTIASISNYDYIFDFIFHQNGALEVKVSPSGYIASTLHTSLGSQYGFRLHERIAGPIHHHMFHFKADLDIKGIHNRFETIDLSEDVVFRGEWSKSPDEIHSQTKISRNLKRNELNAAYTFNFSTPKYLIFTNNNMISKYGNSKGYRLLTRGMSKQLIREDIGTESSVSWARYQVAVTKQHDNERVSSSIYSSWDAADPVVRFQKFLDDDEDIVDKDLVAWITLGTHHIPHTEDLPIVTTVGMSLDFFLLPFNYFDEDPAMSSIDAIRVDAFDKDGDKVGVERYGVTSDFKCLPKQKNLGIDLKKDAESLFDYS